MLLGAAALVLLIAGVNVAAMLSARYTARRREMAVRAALGAGRGRLLRQLLTEILMLFAIGAAAGFVVAVGATAALEQLPLPANLPISLELSPDLRVLAFAVGISLLAGLAFGLAPALGAARKDITSRLRADSTGGGRRRSRLGRRDDRRADCADPGAAGGRRAVRARARPGPAGRSRLRHGQRRHRHASIRNRGATTKRGPASSSGTLRERVEGLGTVAAASYTGRLPLMAGSSIDNVMVDGAELAIHYTPVDTDYFRSIGIPVVAGRAFDDTDGRGAPNVAIVNETLARRIAAGRQRHRPHVPLPQHHHHHVVGVARDAKYATLLEDDTALRLLPARADLERRPRRCW